MDRLREFFRPSEPAYKPVDDDSPDQENSQTGLLTQSLHTEDANYDSESPFRWTHYAVFTLLGVAMLWAWNMFLAAGPYFLSRLASSPSLSSSFQSAELSVSTASNLVAMLVLTNLQTNASYPRRIILALLINMGVFLLMALSTVLFLGVSAPVYFGFLMAMVLVSSVATGLMQNGIFAYMASFAVEEYAQGQMTGQALAGVLPAIVQIMSVLSVKQPEESMLGITGGGEGAQTASKSAMWYFLTATLISLITLCSFFWLVFTERKSAARTMAASVHSMPPAPKQRVPLWTIYKKVFYLANGVFLAFAVTMFFPVFTLKIQSVHSGQDISRLFAPGVFPSLGFLVWNLGDLSGRVLTALPALRSPTRTPRLLFFASLARIGFIALYQLCNIDGLGAIIPSDFFYLIIVQFCFGISNGYIGTLCMMGAGEYVDIEEREATGAFMTLMIVCGLTVGSVASFIVS